MYNNSIERPIAFLTIPCLFEMMKLILFLLADGDCHGKLFWPRVYLKCWVSDFLQNLLSLPSILSVKEYWLWESWENI